MVGRGRGEVERGRGGRKRQRRHRFVALCVMKMRFESEVHASFPCCKASLNVVLNSLNITVLFDQMPN